MLDIILCPVSNLKHNVSENGSVSVFRFTPETETTSIYWAQQSRIDLKTEAMHNAQDCDSNVNSLLYQLVLKRKVRSVMSRKWLKFFETPVFDLSHGICFMKLSEYLTTTDIFMQMNAYTFLSKRQVSIHDFNPYLITFNFSRH
jgi:hypothetical protein